MASNDGWQTIPPKGRRGRQRLADIIAREAVNAQTDGGSPPSSSVLSLAELAADHEKLCARWRNSSSHMDLRSIISDHAARHELTRTAICLGVGSFDVKDRVDRGCRASSDAHIQLEAFRVIVGALEAHTDQPIKCYAQEPSFTPSDKEFCASLGIEVLESPAAFGHVGPDTFVFGIHLPHYAWGFALVEQLPGLYVGTDLESLDRLNTSLREDEVLKKVIERVGEIGAGADRWAFPGAERGGLLETTFAGTDILWMRREGDEDGAEVEQEEENEEEELGEK